MRRALPAPAKEEEPPDLGRLQRYGEEEHPIAHASRTLKDAELRYSATEREALAIWWACNYPMDYSDDRKGTSSQTLSPPASDSNQDFGGSTDAVGVSVLAVSQDACYDHACDEELSARFQGALLEIGYEYPIEREFDLGGMPLNGRLQGSRNRDVFNSRSLLHCGRPHRGYSRASSLADGCSQRLANPVPLTGIDILELDQERHVRQSQNTVGIRPRWNCPGCALL